MKMAIGEISSGKPNAGKRQILLSNSHFCFLDQFSTAFIRSKSQSLALLRLGFFNRYQNHKPYEELVRFDLFPNTNAHLATI